MRNAGFEPHVPVSYVEVSEDGEYQAGDLTRVQAQVVFGNSLQAADREKPPGMRSTAAAIHHIAQRQSEGWGYFRA